MSVDEKTVRRIAHLARIAVTDDEVGPLQGELNAILRSEASAISRARSGVSRM